MARYIGPHNSGNEHGFIYDISGEDPSAVAQRIIASADMPFTFQGQLQGQVSEITPMQVASTLERGGMVAAFAQVGGTTVTVRFSGPNQVLVIPHNGRQEAADRLMGTGFSGGYNDYGANNRIGSPAGPGGYGYDDYNMIDEIERESGTLPANSGEIPVGVLEWILTWILLAIPIVNIICIIVWLVSKKTKKSKKNYVIATLIVAILSILLTGAAVFFFGDQLKPYLQNLNIPGITATTNANANANANANGNLADRMIENIDEDTNENAAGSEGTEGAPEGEVPVEGEASVVEEPAPVASMEVNLDAATFQTLPDNRRIIVVTATAYNTGQTPFRPSEALRLMANQGIANLERNLTPGDSFLPSTMEDEIAPAASGSFQFSYYLADEQPVHITVLNEATLGTVADREYPVATQP